MRIRGIAAVVLALIMACCPQLALAGSKSLDLQTSATQTATGTGGGIAVDNLREILVFADCTASAGTGVLDLYLQSSSDGGVTWYDLPFETMLVTTLPASATEGTHATPNITVVNGSTPQAPGSIGAREIFQGMANCTTEQRAVAVYRTFGNLIRAAWVVTVTSAPSYTFSVKVVGKT